MWIVNKGKVKLVSLPVGAPIINGIPETALYNMLERKNQDLISRLTR